MKNKSPTKLIWCEEQEVHLPELGSIGDSPNVPSKIRCPKCKKRFEPTIRDCNDGIKGGCWHVYLPPHKKRIKVINE